MEIIKKMKKVFTLISLILFFTINTKAINLPDSTPKNVKKYIGICRTNIYKEMKGMYREAGGALKYPFLVPGSQQYNDELWDWDSWLCNIAIRQILLENGTEKDRKEATQYEQGCVLNFLSYGGFDGWVPYLIQRNTKTRWDAMPKNPFEENMHKPVLAQHTAFLVKQNNGDAEWLRDKFYELQAFENNYINHRCHKETGLYYWKTDQSVIGDNDPCIFGRPPGSTGSIILNCLMYKELLSMVYLSGQLAFPEIGQTYQKEADKLKEAILKNCWDERDGFFYNVDLNLTPYKTPEVAWGLHSGGPRNWDCVIMRIGVWSGFTALWAGVATPGQAKRVVNENYKNTKTFNCRAGVRSLSKMEKMYDLRATGNPSNWLGPVWIVVNYMTWKGLVKYGYTKEARELAEKTVVLLGSDFERFGGLHEYYMPESGEPILNKGFQNWNFLVLNMAAWLEGKPVVEEF